MATLEKWFFALNDKTILNFDREEFLLNETLVDSSDYPEFIEIGVQRFPLFYEFNPGSPRDGITVYIKSSALNSVSAQDFDYLIPALLKDKIEALLRTLPKQYRKKLLPIADYAQYVHETDSYGGKRAKYISGYMRSDKSICVIKYQAGIV